MKTSSIASGVVLGISLIAGPTVSNAMAAPAHPGGVAVAAAPAATGLPKHSSTKPPVTPTATPSASRTSSTVVGPATPTIDEPGDNEPALVIGGSVLLLAALIGAWFFARGRVQNDPR